MAKSGPDSPLPAFHSPASAKGSCCVCSLGSWSAAKGSWIHSSLFRVFVFGKRWPGQARTVRSRKTFPAGFTPEGLGKGGPDRPGQRFVLESIPVFNNHSLGLLPRVFVFGQSFVLAGHAFLRVFVWPFLLDIHSLGFTPYGFSGFGQRFVPSALLGFSSSAKGSWIHTL